MTRSLSLLLLLTVMALSACDTGQQVADQAKLQSPADSIYYGGDIVTMAGDVSEYVEALVVKDGLIAFAGTKQQAMSYRADATRMHDLQGHTLLPGFIDAHGHTFVTGFQNKAANLMAPPDGDGTDIAALVKITAQWAQENADFVEKVGWIVGYGYDDAQLKEGRHPTADDLDKVSTDVPVMMVHQSAHLMSLNHKALEMIAYTAETPDPPGGVIRREADGKTPNGVLEESAKFKPQIALFSSFDAAGNEMLALSGLESYMRNGFTTAQEGKARAADVRVWQQLATQDRLPIDVAVTPDLVSQQELLKTAQFSPDYDNHFRIAGVKLTLDGSPQGFTAWLTQPYHKPREGLAADYRGYPAISDQQQVNRLVLQAFENNWQLNAHCNGDAASDQLLDAVENANRELGKADRRSVMVHAQTLRPEQLDRMKENDVMPSFFAVHTFYWGDWHVERTLGRERAHRIDPTGTALDKGMIFTLHHDAPIIFPNSMMILQTAVTRVSRKGEVIGPDERISPYVALLAITRWAAYQYFEDGQKGSLEPGKLADLVILDNNPLKVDPMTISHIRVLETIKEGKSVYKADPGEIAQAIEVKTADDYLSEELVIEHGDAANHVRLYMEDGASGDFITILPSLGRGVEDYMEQYNSTLTTRLAQAGFKVLLVQPRGIGKSKGDLTPENTTMQVLADDIKATLDAMDIKKLHVAGHAFGNRVARTFATLYPDTVDRVILLASGGNFELTQEAEACLGGAINLKLPDEERLEMIDCAFFAEGNDASVWLAGWYPRLALAQVNATQTIEQDFYKSAGGKNILLVQAAEDLVAPPGLAGKALAAELGDQVTYVEVEHAGHALTSEQPEIVAQAIVEYLASQK